MHYCDFISLRIHDSAIFFSAIYGNHYMYSMKIFFDLRSLPFNIFSFSYNCEITLLPFKISANYIVCRIALLPFPSL